MPDMELKLAQKLGVFVNPDFLAVDTCIDIRQQMKDAPGQPMTIYDPVKQQGGIVDDSRLTFNCNVSSTLQSTIRTQLKHIQPDLEQHFNDRFATIETPVFFIYDTDHFFGLHNDDVFGRKVNITIFLNNEAADDQATLDESSCYTGGTLTLYGLLNKPCWQQRGIPIRGQTGMLVAYSALLNHEVTPVQKGQRFAIVSHGRGLKTLADDRKID
ncbi:MAG: 2OG-Fe(II) oxygenase [Chloroflexota bacterium]